jgi:hypothetical protein
MTLDSFFHTDTLGLGHSPVPYGQLIRTKTKNVFFRCFRTSHVFTLPPLFLIRYNVVTSFYLLTG